MPLLAVLGLRDPEGGDWGRLRGLQYAQLIKTARWRITVHALCAFLTLATYAGKAPVWLMAVFVAGMCTGLFFTLRSSRSFVFSDRPRISRPGPSASAAAPR